MCPQSVDNAHNDIDTVEQAVSTVCSVVAPNSCAPHNFHVWKEGLNTDMPTLMHRAAGAARTGRIVRGVGGGGSGG